jgi:4'-phosphopantetheinyl transferase
MNTSINNSQVHVWQATLKSLNVLPGDISDFLSPCELERANKLKFPHDQEQFILRHYLLRIILSKYCDCHPCELRFRYNSYEKPYIDLPEFNEINFNMSSSDDLIIIGLCRNSDIGIDVEKVHQIQDMEQIAQENFSHQELTYFNCETDKTAAFFNIWTRKEAFIKAIGKGFYFPLKSFYCEFSSSGGYENITIPKHPVESKLWKTKTLKAADGYVASLAINSARFNILYFQL